MKLEESIAQSSAGEHWKRLGIGTHHGIAIPLFSLRNSVSAGIGEYLDLIPLIDWAKSLGFTIIQLLPLNDTGLDTSPYNALSAFALNPIHISLSGLSNLSPDLMRELAELQKLNASQRVDYELVRLGKEQFLQEYYRQEGKNLSASKEYEDFVKKNPWLKQYALFKALKIATGWQSWRDWSPSLQNLDAFSFQKLCEQFQKEIEVQIFLQYLCGSQLKRVKDYASEKNLFIKGDIPILISRESADVWANPSLFHLQYSAGAPPDMYSDIGQNWGFPVYNWDEMEKQGYKWWKERLQCASNYYHLYRIDHVVGFFRIWAIPDGKSGKEGFFIPHDFGSWLQQGERIMRMMLEASTLLPVGEDLGTVPNEVRHKLTELGIPGTKVMRWERYWEGDRSFIPIHDYKPLSMTTVSTHDSEPLKFWWALHPDEAGLYCQQRGWNYTTPLSLNDQFEILRDSHHSGSLLHINLLNEYLALFPELVWENQEDERINLPGTSSDKNWSYRLRPYFSELFAHKGLETSIRELLA